MKVHLRAHEFGPTKPRIRMWSGSMQSYGQFNVVSYDDAQKFVDMMYAIGIGTAVAHRCDGMGDRRCHELTYGEQINDYID